MSRKKTMENTTGKTIEQMREDINTIIDTTNSTISNMKDNERMPVKDIAKAVGLTLSIEPQLVLPFVDYFTHNTIEGRVSAGRFGGFIKSGRKTNKPTTETSSTTSE